MCIFYLNGILRLFEGFRFVYFEVVYYSDMGVWISIFWLYEIELDEKYLWIVHVQFIGLNSSFSFIKSSQISDY